MDAGGRLKVESVPIGKGAIFARTRGHGSRCGHGHERISALMGLVMPICQRGNPPKVLALFRCSATQPRAGSAYNLARQATASADEPPYANAPNSGGALLYVCVWSAASLPSSNCGVQSSGHACWVGN